MTEKSSPYYYYCLYGGNWSIAHRAEVDTLKTNCNGMVSDYLPRSWPISDSISLLPSSNFTSLFIVGRILQGSVFSSDCLTQTCGLSGARLGAKRLSWSWNLGSAHCLSVETFVVEMHWFPRFSIPGAHTYCPGWLTSRTQTGWAPVSTITIWYPSLHPNASLLKRPKHRPSAYWYPVSKKTPTHTCMY